MNTIKKTFLNDGVVLLKNVWDQTTIRQIIEEYDTEIKNGSQLSK